MLWVGLATLIMLITGTGDDTREFRKRVHHMEKAVDELVVDASRKQAVSAALKQTSQAFFDHRARLDLVGKCITEADANYEASREDYEECLKTLDPLWETAAHDFIAAEKDFRAALEPKEFNAVLNRVITN
jgi:hypothetical protein